MFRLFIFFSKVKIRGSANTSLTSCSPRSLAIQDWTEKKICTRVIGNLSVCVKLILLPMVSIFYSSDVRQILSDVYVVKLGTKSDVES